MKQKYNVEGMTCSACSAHVDRAVRKLNGVISCNVNLLSNTMEVEFDEKILTTSDIEKSVKDAGYKAYTSSVKSSKKKDTALVKLIVCFSLLVILMYITMGHMIGLHLPKFLSGTENAIVYGNRYRPVHKNLDRELTRAEDLFYNGEYKKALDNTIRAINVIEPGIQKKLLESAKR